MQVLAGTSGYAYQEWKGNFYPKNVKPQEMLRLYGERLKTVEINSTFYRMPSEKMLLSWTEQVPDDFSFVLKASRRITHLKRLQDVDDVLSYMLQNSTVLGSRLGPMLFQLPPDLTRDTPRLVDFLGRLPPRWPSAFEFRHESWFVDEVYDALRARDAALVISDGENASPPIVATASLGYLRLRREEYDDAQLKDWVARIGEQEWERAFVFFKHGEQGASPRFAARLNELLP